MPPELLTKQLLYVRLIIDNQNKKAHSIFSFFKRLRPPAPRQDNGEFRELAGHRRDIDRPAVLFDDDVVAHRKAEPGAFTGRLGREERVENLSLTSGGNAGAVVANADFDAVAEFLVVAVRSARSRAAAPPCAWSRRKSRW